MNSCELVSLVTSVACAIAKCAPKEDLPIISAVLGQTASTLATIIVREEAADTSKNKLPDLSTPVVPNNEIIIS